MTKHVRDSTPEEAAATLARLKRGSPPAALAMSRPPRSWLPVQRCLQILVTVARMAERAGEAAGFKFKAHAHMVRHACGFALANKGHDTRALQAYLGHRNIRWRRGNGLQLFDASRCRSFARPSLVTLSAGRVFPDREHVFLIHL
jgi:integrase